MKNVANKETAECGRPIEHRHELTIGRAGLGGECCTCFPQPMGGAMGQSSFVAPLTEARAKSSGGEWFPVLRDKKPSVTAAMMRASSGTTGFSDSERRL